MKITMPPAETLHLQAARANRRADEADKGLGTNGCASFLRALGNQYESLALESEAQQKQLSDESCGGQETIAHALALPTNWLQVVLTGLICLLAIAVVCGVLSGR